MFRVKMLFSTVSISNSNYCFNIFTLPGNWAMLENKLHIWSLFRGVAGGVKVNVVSEGPSLRTHLPLSQLQTTRVGWGNLEAIKGDKGWLFCTSVHSQKRENHVYWDLILNKKIMSITTRNFARITKKILWKAEQNCLHQKGTEFSLSDPFQKRPSVALLFCQQLVVCQVTFRRRRPLHLQRKGLTGFVWSPNLPVLGQVCVSWPRPPRPNQSQHVLSLYFTRRGMHVKGKYIYRLKKSPQ